VPHSLVPPAGQVPAGSTASTLWSLIGRRSGKGMRFLLL
jgi:hypothetical protein